MQRGIFAQPDTAVVELMGVCFTPWTEYQVVTYVIDSLQLGSPGGWIVTPNVDILRRLFRDRSSRTTVRDATFALADGMPLVWASLLQRTPLPERVTGASLLGALCAAAASAGNSVYLLGGGNGVANEAADRIRADHPGLSISGWSPPFGLEATAEGMNEIHERVRASGADVVFCGFGFPKQEKVIAELVENFPRTWFVGCGASLTFAAGRISRAPDWMQRAGLEWLHRLGNEPTRLFRRYFVDDLPFACRIMAVSAGRRLATAPVVDPLACAAVTLPLPSEPEPLEPAGVVASVAADVPLRDSDLSRIAAVR